MTNLDTIERLNRLIVTTKNGESSLRAAAEEAHHAELKQSLLEYSRCFADTARELQEAVRRLGGKPQEIGTFGGTLHRTWMHIKATALGRDERTILDECEREEDEAKLCFEQALHDDMPPEVHDLLARQYQETLRHHDEVRALRDQVTTRH
jgi:uncharacterized protein (TIGR02284 family)